MILTIQDIDDIAHGACIYACGGGGAASLLQSFLEQIGDSSVELIDVEQIEPTSKLAIPAAAGSPDAATGSDFAKKLADAALNAFNGLSEQVGQPFNYAIAIEVGIINTLIPIAVAAKSNIPVMDGAGARRSFPILPMCTFSSNGVPIAPLVLATNDNSKVSHQVEPIGEDGGAAAAQAPMSAILSTPEFGNIGGIAFWEMTGTQAKDTATRAAVSDALRLGQVLREARHNHQDPVEAVRQEMEGYILLRRGQLAAEEKQTSNSLDFTKVVFEDLDNRS